MGAAVCNPKTGSADMPRKGGASAITEPKLVAGAEVISRRIMIYDKEADDFIPGSVAAFDAKTGEPCGNWRHDSIAVFLGCVVRNAPPLDCRPRFACSRRMPAAV